MRNSSLSLGGTHSAKPLQESISHDRILSLGNIVIPTLTQSDLRDKTLQRAGEPSCRIYLVQLITNRMGMSVNKIPEEVLDSITKGINAGDLESLMTLYEPQACFATQPGTLATSPDGIRESLRNFIDMKGKLELKVKSVLRANDLALVTTEWSFSGTESDGKPVNITSKSADVLRQQPNGTWRLVIDNPWGTD